MFQKLDLPESWNIHHVTWPPLAPQENLTTYVLKISSLIDVTQNFALVGLSFGGIIATELTKILNPKKTIIISSISTRQELPFNYRLLGASSAIHLMPTATMNKVYPFTYWFFGVTTSDDKAMLKQIILDTSPAFLKWALNEILIWKNEVRPKNLIHIHGTSDRLFPYRLVKADYTVAGGGHWMVYNQAKHISKILVEELNKP